MTWQLPVFSFHCPLKHYFLVLEESEMLKLILADDEEMIRESIRALIDWNSIGVEVVASCKNGPETLQAILTLHPDIVMTDIKMPGMSGLDLILNMLNKLSPTEFPTIF